MNKEKAEKTVEDFNKLCSILGAHYSDLKYSIAQLPEVFKLCSYTKDDRVVLARTPEISPTVSWGWMGAKHILIAGAKATIKEIEFYNGKFIFGLIFDNESWIDYQKKIHPIELKDRSVYMFGESWIKKIDPPEPILNYEI